MVRNQEQPPEVWHSLTLLVYAPSLLKHKIQHSQLYCYRRNTARAFHTALTCLKTCITFGIYCVLWTPTLYCNVRDQDAFQAIPLEALKCYPLDQCAHSLVKHFLPVFKGICSYQWSQLHITGHSKDCRYSSKEYLTQHKCDYCQMVNFLNMLKAKLCSGTMKVYSVNILPKPLTMRSPYREYECTNSVNKTCYLQRIS